MALKTDYKNYIPSTAMNGRRRYRMINNDDGTVSFEDATEYSQVGDSFGAAVINETNKNINNLELISYPRKAVTSEDNLNSFLDNGWYNIPYSSYATLDKNYPEAGIGGVLFVYRSGVSTLQIYFGFGGDSNFVHVFSRHYFQTNNYWSAWTALH